MKLRPLVLTSALILSCSLGLAACGDGSTADGKGGTLTILGSSPDINAAWQKSVDAQFEKATGATIKWLPGAAPDNLTKLIQSKGGTPPADVVFLDTPTQTEAIQADVLDKFDATKLTDSGPQIPDSLYANEGYGPAGIVIRLGTCVNTKSLEDAGIAAPTSVDGWFDPKLKGHFAMPDISTFYTPATLPALAENYGVSLDDPSGLLDKIQAADPATFWTSTADAQQSLQSGDLWETPLNDGRCLNLAIQGQPVDFLPLNLNIEGKQYPYIGLFDTWDLVKGSDQSDLAYKFIDIVENQKSMSPLMTAYGYLPPRSDVLATMKADPKLKAYVGDYDPSQLYVPDYTDWFAKYYLKWQDAWTELFKK
jgi:spermidine/putrescine-binding protein